MPGGCANDYEYVSGDPINDRDLAGTRRARWRRWLSRRYHSGGGCRGGFSGILSFFSVRGYVDAIRQLRHRQFSAAARDLGLQAISAGSVKIIEQVARKFGKTAARIVGRVIGTPATVVATIIDYTCGRGGRDDGEGAHYLFGLVSGIDVQVQHDPGRISDLECVLGHDAVPYQVPGR